MLLDENWAIGINRIREFFGSQNDVTGSGNEFYYKNCCITLISLPPSQSGIFSTARTQIRMDGPDADLQEIHHRFFLRFLSAGG